MKASVAPAATRRVLAGIDAVLRERTAQAVERVLATVSPAPYENAWGHITVTEPLSRGLGFELVRRFGCDGPCDACDSEGDVDNLPGLTYVLDASLVPDRDRRRYAPWVVSPHLFGGES